MEGQHARLFCSLSQKINLKSKKGNNWGENGWQCYEANDMVCPLSLESGVSFFSVVLEDMKLDANIFYSKFGPVT